MMRPKTFRILELAVEDGVQHGWQRAHKHTDSPDEKDIVEAIQKAVLSGICEWFTFDDED